MAYTTPPTFVADDVLAADDLNILGADIEYLKGIADGVTFSGCQLRRAANQSISSSSDTNVSWDTENFDYGGWYSSGTKVIVPSGAIPGGYDTVAVMVIAAIKFATDGTGKRKMNVVNNGTAFGTWKVSALDDDTTAIYMTEFTTVSAADEIQLQVWQNSGSSLNLTEARLTVVRYAPAT